MKYLLYFCLITLFLVSCARRKTDCYDPGIAALAFTSSNTDYTIADDSVRLLKYTQRTNYTDLLFEYALPLEQNGKSVRVVFPVNVRGEAYDWEMTLYPSGKTYWLQNIHYGNDQVKQHRFHKNLLVCGNVVFYTVNGAAATFDPQGPFSGISLPITY